MNYLAIGDLMMDTVQFADGNDSGVNAGGPVAFGYTGIRLWCDECLIVCNAGADYYKYYESWLIHNDISTKGIRVKTDYTNHFIITYNEDGSYEYNYGLDGKWGEINFGYLKVDPEQIEPFCPGLKGLYIDQPVDVIFWDKMIRLKKKYGFRILWEVQRETHYRNPEPLIRKIVNDLDMFSINSREGREFFHVQTDDEIIEILKTFKTPCFFRTGEKGAHLIMDKMDYFVPSIVIDRQEDPTGCGNSSTATAMYAYCEGYTPYEIVLMANITAAYNVRQYGLIPDFGVREDAKKLFEEMRKQYI